MKRLVDEAIEALTAFDAARLDRLLGELAICQAQPPSQEAVRAALPGYQVLGALLLETGRNLSLLRRTSPCGFFQNATGVDVYPAAWQKADLKQIDSSTLRS